jgi:hypothetical protein
MATRKSAPRKRFAVTAFGGEHTGYETPDGMIQCKGFAFDPSKVKDITFTEIVGPPSKKNADPKPVETKTPETNDAD